MSVTVSFSYEPMEPDPADRTGMSEDEHGKLMDKLMELGAEDVKIEA